MNEGDRATQGGELIGTVRKSISSLLLSSWSSEGTMELHRWRGSLSSSSSEGTMEDTLSE